MNENKILKRMISLDYKFYNKFQIDNFVFNTYKNLSSVSLKERMSCLDELKQKVKEDIKIWNNRIILRILCGVILTILITALGYSFFLPYKSNYAMYIICRYIATFVISGGLFTFFCTFPTIKNKRNELKKIDIKIKILDIYKEYIGFSGGEMILIICEIKKLLEEENYV